MKRADRMIRIKCFRHLSAFKRGRLGFGSFSQRWHFRTLQVANQARTIGEEAEKLLKQSQQDTEQALAEI